MILEGLAEQFLKKVRDTRTLTEADGADWARRFYQLAIQALPEKPGIQVWIDTIGEYFAQGPRQKDDPTIPPAAGGH